MFANITKKNKQTKKIVELQLCRGKLSNLCHKHDNACYVPTRGKIDIEVQ